jgi:hypothetical protein
MSIKEELISWVPEDLSREVAEELIDRLIEEIMEVDIESEEYRNRIRSRSSDDDIFERAIALARRIKREKLN